MKIFSIDIGNTTTRFGLIVEDQTTTWISSKKKLTVQQDECLPITKKTGAAE